nr:hypothetical protein [uncultured Draconibacterium sp.]
MKNIRETIQKANELEEFASERAIDLIEAKVLNLYNKKPYPYFISGVELNTDNIEVSFCEDTRHDCPEGGGVTLTIADLEMEETKWKEKIRLISNETKEKMAKKEAKERELSIKIKKLQLEQLKQELGE